MVHYRNSLSLKPISFMSSIKKSTIFFSFVRRGSKFVQALSLGSIQFAAHIKSADLPKLSPNINQPRPPTRKDENGEELQVCVSLSAGNIIIEYSGNRHVNYINFICRFAPFLRWLYEKLGKGYFHCFEGTFYPYRKI